MYSRWLKKSDILEISSSANLQSVMDTNNISMNLDQE